MNNKSILITGSTSGIGRGIAHYFAKRNYHIMINGLADKKDIDILMDDLKKCGAASILYDNADMCDNAAIARMVRRAEDEFSGLYILVNNAGIQHVAPVEEFPEEKWQQILQINLSAAFYATRAIVPFMKGRKTGRIINIASAHGLVASPYKSAYVAAKHGVIGLTKTVALELATHGITCNAICPGFVHTPLVDNQIAAQQSAHGLSADKVVEDIILASQPTKKFVGIDEVAAMAHYLASDAAKSVTGASLQIDGGWVAR